MSIERNDTGLADFEIYTENEETLQCSRVRRKQESSSFLKKRTKKNFYQFGAWAFHQHNLKEQKFFGSFFQKRTAFFCLLGRR